MDLKHDKVNKIMSDIEVLSMYIDCPAVKAFGFTAGTDLYVAYLHSTDRDILNEPLQYFTEGCRTRESIKDMWNICMKIRAEQITDPAIQRPFWVSVNFNVEISEEKLNTKNGHSETLLGLCEFQCAIKGAKLEDMSNSETLLGLCEFQ